MGFSEKDFEKVKKFIEESSDSSKIYFGADSERFKSKGRWYARYTVVVVVHKDGCKGAKVFGYSETEEDYDKKFNRPTHRLLTETYKVSELYLLLAEAINSREIEVHLDINPNIIHGSSCAVQQAVGYIKGICGIQPKLKPEAFAASYAADRGNW